MEEMASVPQECELWANAIINRILRDITADGLDLVAALIFEMYVLFFIHKACNL